MRKMSVKKTGTGLTSAVAIATFVAMRQFAVVNEVIMAYKTKLSNFELEVMQFIWDAGEIVAPDVHKLISANRKVSYSALKTIFDRLEEKGAIRRVRTYGRTILWGAAIQREDVAGSLVSDFMTRIFGGKVRPLMSHVLQKEDLTMDDISYLEALLEARKKDLEAGE